MLSYIDERSMAKRFSAAIFSETNIFIILGIILFLIFWYQRINLTCFLGFGGQFDTFALSKILTADTSFTKLSLVLHKTSKDPIQLHCSFAF